MHIQLDKFEGPLALLLYLIRKEEMDIYDIEMTKITRQYLEHLNQMKELDLEGAGEFIAMAATLIQIKSQMLLPNYNENGEVVEPNIDPRKALVQRLIEYQKYQEASHLLNDRPLLGRDVWARGISGGIKETFTTASADQEIEMDEKGLFSLIAAYRTVVRNMKKATHVVKGKIQSIASRIMEMKDGLIPGTRVLLTDLLKAGEQTKVKVLVTFLSILELSKLGFTQVFQAETYGPIHIDTIKVIDGDVLARVEDYDNQNAEAVANSLLEVKIVEFLEDQITEHQLHLDEVLDSEGTVAVVEVATDEEIFAEEQAIALEDATYVAGENQLTAFDIEKMTFATQSTERSVDRSMNVAVLDEHGNDLLDLDFIEKSMTDELAISNEESLQMAEAVPNEKALSNEKPEEISEEKSLAGEGVVIIHDSNPVATLDANEAMRSDYYLDKEI